MAHQLRMPSLGQTTDELRIVAWLKAEGDVVALAEPILEVETDKAILQVESSFAGTLLKILRTVEDIVSAGEPIAYIGQPGENPAEVTPATIQPIQPGEAAAAAGKAATVPAVVHANPNQGLATLATPVARKMAKEHGIDLRAVQGSGPDGRIEKRDVEALISTHAVAPVPNAAPVPVNVTQTVDALNMAVPRHRQVIAERLTRSVQTIPHITLNMTVDMRAARSLVAHSLASGLTGLTITHVLLQAVARALRAHPHLNRLWCSDGPTYHQLMRADVGLAVASEDNLIVATIPEPDQFDLAALVRVADEVIGRARRGMLAQADTAPAAITISNLGRYSVDSFQAIVDPDQSMILAVGRIADQVVAIQGGIHVVPQMTMSLTVDHRVADGAAAAKFLNTIREELERSNV